MTDDVHSGRQNMLSPGATVPPLSLELVGGSCFEVPGNLAADYTVLLFYRGHW
ncbi:MAG: hypothetical protein AAGG11_20570 [Pseudomonadota bacterium]